MKCLKIKRQIKHKSSVAVQSDENCFITRIAIEMQSAVVDYMSQSAASFSKQVNVELDQNMQKNATEEWELQHMGDQTHSFKSYPMNTT